MQRNRAIGILAVGAGAMLSGQMAWAANHLDTDQPDLAAIVIATSATSGGPSVVIADTILDDVEYKVPPPPRSFTWEIVSR